MKTNISSLKFVSYFWTHYKNPLAVVISKKRKSVLLRTFYVSLYSTDEEKSS